MAQGGLFDWCGRRDFASSRLIFLTYREPARGTHQAPPLPARRAVRTGATLEDVHHITGKPLQAVGGRHFGSASLKRLMHALSDDR
jgi:hypothetical protein